MRQRCARRATPLILPELLTILVVFGANRIQPGEALGHGIQNFKKTFEKDDSVNVTWRRSRVNYRTPSATAEGLAGADKKVHT